VTAAKRRNNTNGRSVRARTKTTVSGVAASPDNRPPRQVDATAAAVAVAVAVAAAAVAAVATNRIAATNNPTAVTTTRASMIGRNSRNEIPIKAAVAGTVARTVGDSRVRACILKTRQISVGRTSLRDK